MAKALKAAGVEYMFGVVGIPVTRLGVTAQVGGRCMNQFIVMYVGIYIYAYVLNICIYVVCRYVCMYMYGVVGIFFVTPLGATAQVKKMVVNNEWGRSIDYFFI